MNQSVIGHCANQRSTDLNRRFSSLRNDFKRFDTGLSFYVQAVQVEIHALCIDNRTGFNEIAIFTVGPC